MNNEISPEKLLEQLDGFLEEFSYPKGKEAIEAVQAATVLALFIENLLDEE